MDRARGWRRIGIVLSVVWFIGFGGYIWTSEATRLQTSLLAHTDLCYSILKSANDALAHIPNQEQREKRYTENLAKHEECGDRVLRLVAAERDNLWRSIPLFLAFDAGTVVFGWLVVWLVTLVVRWVQRGFAPA
jgi:hypothetical protein